MRGWFGSIELQEAYTEMKEIMQEQDRSNGICLLRIVAVYVLLVVGISLLPGRLPYEMVREHGPIETLSAAGYFYFCLFLFHFNYIGAVKTSFAPGFFVLLLGLRELDFHQRFTTMGMFKTKFFISPGVPGAEKIIVTMLLAGLLIYGIIYLRRSLPTFKGDLFGGRPSSFSIACAVGCAVLSKFLDGNSEIFAAMFPMVENFETFSITVEECLELFIPVFFIQALLQYGRESVRRRTAESTVGN